MIVVWMIDENAEVTMSTGNMGKDLVVDVHELRNWIKVMEIGYYMYLEKFNIPLA